VHERLDRLRCAGEAAVIPGEGKHLVPPRRCCGEKRLSMGDSFGVGLDPLLFSKRLMRVVTTGLGEIGRFQRIDIDLRLASEDGGEGVPRLIRSIAFGDDTEQFVHLRMEFATAVVQLVVERLSVGNRIRTSLLHCDPHHTLEFDLSNTHRFDHLGFKPSQDPLNVLLRRGDLRLHRDSPVAVRIDKIRIRHRGRIGGRLCELGGQRVEKRRRRSARIKGRYDASMGFRGVVA